MKDNGTKVITIAALVIAVIALSIGFAAFASTLNISTSASVTPNDTFVVKFSKENGSLVDNQPVQASEGSQYGGSATINNSDVKNPTIGNLSASFTQPGQSVTYTFYVRNMGNYDAYLTDVKFNNATEKQVFKSCISSGTNPGTQSIVDDVCDDITFTLELEDTPNKVLTSTLDFAQVVGNDYKVLKSTTPNTGTTNSKMVKVTIAYPQKSGVHYADGSFTVNFGSVEMVFASLAGYIPPAPIPIAETQKCTYADNDSSETITVGDKVSCPLDAQTDSFYVIEDLGQGTTVKMLAEWNLNIQEEGNADSVLYPDAPVGYQNENVKGFKAGETAYGTTRFTEATDYGYWTIGENHDLDTTNYTACLENCVNTYYPSYVYNDNSSISRFVNAYVGYLNSSLNTTATGRLISLEELIELGCVSSSNTCVKSPATAPTWVYQTAYWVGTASQYNGIWNVFRTGAIRGGTMDNLKLFGVRPVIEISSSVIQAS